MPLIKGGPGLPPPHPEDGLGDSNNTTSVNSSQESQQKSHIHESITVASIAPVIVGIVTLLIITFLLVSYYRVLSAWFIRRFAPGTRSNPSSNMSAEEATEQEMEQPLFFVRSNALSESFVRRLPVHKKRKGSISLESCNDCAVCLGEFEEGEDVKILPNCRHGFHVECIDTWLSAHSNICPLCRAKVEPVTGNSDSQLTLTGDAVTGQLVVGRKRASSMDEVGVFEVLRRHLQRSSLKSSSLKEPLPRLTDITVQLESTSSSSREGSGTHLKRSFSWSRVLSVKRKRNDEQEMQVHPEV